MSNLGVCKSALSSLLFFNSPVDFFSFLSLQARLELWCAASQSRGSLSLVSPHNVFGWYSKEPLSLSAIFDCLFGFRFWAQGHNLLRDHSSSLVLSCFVGFFSQELLPCFCWLKRKTWTGTCVTYLLLVLFVAKSMDLECQLLLSHFWPQQPL